jgi:hypothetical protein
MALEIHIQKDPTLVLRGHLRTVLYIMCADLFSTMRKAAASKGLNICIFRHCLMRCVYRKIPYILSMHYIC